MGKNLITVVTMKSRSINKEDIIQLDVYAENPHGEGIAKHDDFIVFIKGAKKGSKCRVRVIDVKRTYAIAEII